MYQMASFLQKVFTLSVTNTIEGERRRVTRVLAKNPRRLRKGMLSNSSVGKNAENQSGDPFAEALCSDILVCASMACGLR